MKKLLVASMVAGSVLAGTAASALASPTLGVPIPASGEAQSPITGTVHCNLGFDAIDTVVLGGAAGQATVDVNQLCSENALDHRP